MDIAIYNYSNGYTIIYVHNSLNQTLFLIDRQKHRTQPFLKANEHTDSNYMTLIVHIFIIICDMYIQLLAIPPFCVASQ